MRNEHESYFKLIEKEATELTQECDISTEYRQNRQRKRTRFHCRDQMARRYILCEGNKQLLKCCYTELGEHNPTNITLISCRDQMAR